MSLDEVFDFLVVGFLEHFSKHPAIRRQSVVLLFLHLILPLKLILVDLFDSFFFLLFFLEIQVIFNQKLLFMVKVSGLGLVLKCEHLITLNRSGDDFLGLWVKQFDKIFFQNGFMRSFFHLHDIPDHEGVIFGVNINVLRQR
jgi:hypothetical protein